jgi:hypothetical protein
MNNIPTTTTTTKQTKKKENRYNNETTYWKPASSLPPPLAQEVSPLEIVLYGGSFHNRELQKLHFSLSLVEAVLDYNKLK